MTLAMEKAGMDRPWPSISLVPPTDRHEASNEPLLTLLLEKAHRGRPEQRLMLAVLSDALATVHRRAVPGSRRLREAALAWFAADDWEWPFSFVNVCRATNIDAARVRRALWVSLQGSAGPRPESRRS
jgi:hypothetical protein